MAAQLLPLFPLSFVLLPAMPLPLHIFEERYKEMMNDILPNGHEFGVVLAKPEGIADVGCSANVDRVIHRYDDGRMDLLSIGQRRFRIESVDDEKSYLRASVEYFFDEDESQASASLLQRATESYEQLLKRERSSVTTAPNLSPGGLSFRIAELLYDLDKRQIVLGMKSETERLEFLVRTVPGYLVQQERIELAKRTAPSNGHAKGLKLT